MVGEIARPPTLVAVTIAHVREAIICGDLAPGAPLPEVELSKSLNISRSTVREALRELHDEGLVEIIPHRGAFVTELSVRKAREIYTLRAQLEPYAIRLALENKAYTLDDIQRLKTIVNKLGELGQQENLLENLNVVVKTDIEFHRLVCERSDHQLLLQVLKSLQSQTRLFILNTKLYQSDRIEDEASHRAILEAIQSGTPRHAEEILKKHIMEAGIWLLEQMESQSPRAVQAP